MRQNRVHVRLLMVAGVALLWTTGVFGRLSYLQLIKHGEYLARAQRQQQRTIEITPKRGIIYDRNMRALAMSVPVKSAFAVPAEIADESLAARLLSGVLGVPQDVLEARMASSRSFVWISRKLPPEKVEAIEGLNLKGVYFQDENQRFYPKRDLAAHVLGFVDPDEKGLAGIEYELDNQIRSKSEKIVVMADARQRWFDGGEAQRERGANVILTLDEKIQYIAQRELLAAIEKTRAIAGSVIVVNPNTGEILAMANWPRFNPNAANEAASESRMNRAVSALYEPGSTFKLITLAAAFDQDITRPNEVFDCENGAIYIAGHRIRDHKPCGLLMKPHVVQTIKRGERIVPAEGPLAVPEPKRVIRPETAATLRRLMEGVVLSGTGKLARLDGWTAAGKTGSAQKIDPATGRYSRTQLIASFTGFAPISNPAVTILVSLDSPVGQHEGGQVAAPVFKRIAEQVLPYLDVPRDVPIGPRLLQAAYKNRDVSDSSILEDFTPADFSEQPDQPPAKSAATNTRGGNSAASAVTVAVDEGGDIQVPDFSGKTMREVTEMCLKLGLEPVLVGSSLATNQAPAAGANVRRGAKVTVQFGTPVAKIAKPQRRVRH